MLQTNKITIIISCIFALSGCAHNSTPLYNSMSLTESAEYVSYIIRSGNLSLLNGVVYNPQITFAENGDVDDGIQCFLGVENKCQGVTSNVRSIIAGGYFIFYYHSSSDDVIVSYVRSSRRADFDLKPDVFLEGQYLENYFSCSFTRVDGRWFLRESVCFSETEGPFEVEPDV